jgi:hypothetical protein
MKMLKTLKSAAELVALLNAELRKHDICEDVTVAGVTRVEIDPINYNWTATAIRSSGTPVLGDCSRIFLAGLDLLQRKYDLKSED